MAKTREVCTSRNDQSELSNRMVTSSELYAFKGHPFKVENDMELFELMRSIEKEGVIVPLLVRPNPYRDGYEIIAGHRRKAACEWAGIKEIPVIVRNLDDNQAVIAMVDSNLQRERIRPSEKAFAYKMKLEAMKQQGRRTDLTFSPLDKKLDGITPDLTEPMLENPTVNVSKVECGEDEDGIWRIKNTNNPISTHANEVLAKQIGESTAQLSRYIRLTYLIPKILDMVDEEKLAFRSAVELSYLSEEEQFELHAVMELEQVIPSISQANRMKRMSQAGKLDMNMTCEILGEEKPNQREKIKIYADTLEEYFPPDYTPKQKIELIESLVKEWHLNQKQNRKKPTEKGKGR